MLLRSDRRDRRLRRSSMRVTASSVSFMSPKHLKPTPKSIKDLHLSHNTSSANTRHNLNRSSNEYKNTCHQRKSSSTGGNPKCNNTVKQINKQQHSAIVKRLRTTNTTDPIRSSTKSRTAATVTIAVSRTHTRAKKSTTEVSHRSGIPVSVTVTTGKINKSRRKCTEKENIWRKKEAIIHVALYDDSGANICVRSGKVGSKPTTVSKAHPKG